MITISIEDAQAKLPELIGGLAEGEELVITKDGEPVATLTRSERKQWPNKAGSAKTEGYWMAPDFDAPLEEFREYME